MSNALTIADQMTAERDIDISGAIKGIRKSLLGFIRSRVSSNEDAEDIMQDVFYQFVGNAQPIGQVSNWLFTVARNKITDSYRKKKLPLADDILGSTGADQDGFDWKEVLMPSGTSPETEYLRSLFWEELQVALDELPVEQREVFIQNEIEDVPFKDIAERTGVAVPTLISRKRYAVLHLRERLQGLKDELLNY